MTRKDYVQFAQMFNNILNDTQNDWSGSEYVVWERSVIDTANVFENDNPRFDRTKFYLACGMINE